MQDLKKNKRRINQSTLQHEAKESLNEELQKDVTVINMMMSVSLSAIVYANQNITTIINMMMSVNLVK